MEAIDVLAKNSLNRVVGKESQLNWFEEGKLERKRRHCLEASLVRSFAMKGNEVKTGFKIEAAKAGLSAGVDAVSGLGKREL